MVQQVDPIEYLAKSDPILAKVIKNLPRPEWSPRKNHFQSLVTAIISQQLSTKAADTIINRFTQLFSDEKFPNPEDILSTRDEKIRTAGLSFAKISYTKNLAESIVGGVLDLDTLKNHSDEKVITRLTIVKGIGVWTAEMFLMFSLGREDIFSYADLGLRNGMQNIYQLGRHPTKEEAVKISDRWRPYRSWAARYLWMSLDIY